MYSNSFVYMKHRKTGSVISFIWILGVVLSVSCQYYTSDERMPVTTSSNLAMEYYETGITAFDQLKYADAIDNLKRAIEIDENFFMAYYWLYPLAGEYSKEVADRAFKVDTELSEAEKILQTAFKYMVDSQVEKALEQIDRIIALYPRDVEPYKIKYLIQFQILKDIESARKTIEAAIEVKPDHAISYNMLGYAFMYLEDYKAAEKAFDSYIALAPETANPYDSKGDFLMKMNKFEEAYESYMKAYAIDSSFTMSYKKAQKALKLMENVEST